MQTILGANGQIGEELLPRYEHDNLFDDSKFRKRFPDFRITTHRQGMEQIRSDDMLRVQTGQTTQQHIQNRLIEKGKELLSTTGLSVSEIAYHLGFEHPQSFHRLFKNHTSVSPLEFRASFN